MDITMITIDVLGQPCPVPVVKAKNAIDKMPEEGGVIRVLVDNTIACENLGKLARSQGYEHTVEEESGDRYAVTITVGKGHSVIAAKTETPAAVPASGAGVVVAVGTDSMGHGSEELGRILIKGFIFSLSQLEVPPKAVLFFNSGVRLTLESANTLDDLTVLAEKGTIIRVCGTCVDYYGCKDQVAVGEITNMYGIVELMNGAQTVINL